MKKEQYNKKKLIRPFKKYKKGQIVYADLGNNGPGSKAASVRAWSSAIAGAIMVLHHRLRYAL